MDRAFVVERECGCDGPTVWRWQIVARFDRQDTVETVHIDDVGIVVGYTMTKWGARRKARHGPELLRELRHRREDSREDIYI